MVSNRTISSRSTPANHLNPGGPSGGCECADLLPKQRRELLLRIARESGGVRTRDVTLALGVSEMTVRRDMQALAQMGLLERVHGGATTPQPDVDAVTRATRTAIGDAAAHLISPGSCVALAAGDATLSAATSLAGVADLTVVTNSTRAFGMLNSLPGRRTAVLIGGQRATWDAMVGPIAEQTIATMHFDALITGAFGITSAGVTTRDLAESSTIRRFIAQADHVIVLASAEKWGRQGLAAVATLDEIAVFVTDRKTAQATAFGADFADKLICATRPLAPTRYLARRTTSLLPG